MSKLFLIGWIFVNQPMIFLDLAGCLPGGCVRRQQPCRSEGPGGPCPVCPCQPVHPDGMSEPSGPRLYTVPGRRTHTCSHTRGLKLTHAHTSWMNEHTLSFLNEQRLLCARSLTHPCVHCDNDLCDDIENVAVINDKSVCVTSHNLKVLYRLKENLKKQIVTYKHDV